MNSKMNLINLEYGKGKVELISAQIMIRYRETQKVVPTKTKNWTKEEQKNYR